MGVLDKFLIRSPRGKQASRSRFNPGRDQSWDWNELIKTIEANFEGDFDLVALQAQADASTAANATNAEGIASNDTDIATNASAIATKASTASVTAVIESVNTLNTALGATNTNVEGNTTLITKLCTCLNAVITASENEAMMTAWAECEGNPCVE